MRRWGTVLVSGTSMEPTLRSGDMLLVRYGATVRPADIVVVELPGRPLSVKRAITLSLDGWWVEGDSTPAMSTDSRQLGRLPQSAVLGRAVLRYWPRPRRVS